MEFFLYRMHDSTYNFYRWELTPWLRLSEPTQGCALRTGAEFALYNPDLRRIDYNQINKPTFL